MTKYFFIILISIGIISCASKPYLILKFDPLKPSTANNFSFVNQKGKEVIPMGRYAKAYTDTIKSIGFVGTSQGKIIAIDVKGREVFQVFKNDEQPDYASDGLFRIEKDGKIGYADMAGKIAILPIYKCAFPFYNGKAKVALDCETETKGGYSYWKSEKWIFVGKTGIEVSEK